MTNDQQLETRTRFGSRFAQLFGYVTHEDRARWEQLQAQNEPAVKAIKTGMQSSVDSMLEFAGQNLHAKLDAAHREATKRQFDQSHAKVLNKRRDPDRKSIIETVDYEPRDSRDEIERDWEF